MRWLYFISLLELNMTIDLTDIGKQTRTAARDLANLASSDRQQAIAEIAKALERNAKEIIAANELDCQAAIGNIPAPLAARLKLDRDKLTAAIVGVGDVAKLPDLVGKITIDRELDSGLILQRISCPVGVLGVIFEARPDAVIQIASLAIASGNGVILKCGKEAVNTCTVLVAAIKAGLSKSAVNPDAVQLLTTREETTALLTLDRYVDLIIPRGSNEFVRFVQSNTRIPVLGHADGICHLYIDREAEIDKAISIAIDSKTQYPAACNAIETLLIHQDIAPQLLPELITKLEATGVEIRIDNTGRELVPDRQLIAATETDWQTEYSDLILSIKIVTDLADAIEHISTYGSRHTEAIVTTNTATARTFMASIDAAGVFHNCSTRFADGFRYGFGAEVGISTQKMPPRGPVGLEGLITYKYQLVGDGHIVATYSGANARPFSHRDLNL
jgi:glutamate-5-semialdehyde dehydrogenase